MYSAAEPVYFKASGSWTRTEQRLGGPWRARLLFAGVSIMLLGFDHLLRVSLDGLPMLRSSVGLLWIVLWMSRLRLWPQYLAIHLGGAVAIEWLLQDFLPLRQVLQVAVPGAVTAVVSALACLGFIRGPLRLHMRLVPWIILGLALGAMAGAAAAGALELWSMPQVESVVERVPLLWGGLLLGGLTTGPAVLVWSQARADAHPELQLRSRRQLVLSTCYLIAAVGLAFLWTLLPGEHSLLPLPLLVFPGLVYASFNLPPRWTVLQLTLVNLLCAGLWLLRSDSAVLSADPLVRIGLMQMVLGFFSGVPFILSIVITQVRITMWNLGESEHRYRSFIQLSRDAVWRVEVEPPMPLALPIDEQREWLRHHVRIAEGSQSYSAIAEAGGDRWHLDPWGSELLRRLGDLAGDPPSIEDLRFTTRGARPRSYLANFSATVEDGCLRRLWGVARDVTDLVDLNARLEGERERLRSYARQLAAAEERARRATAVDLHDGIGQTVVGMLMMIDSARAQSSPETRQVLEHMRQGLRDVHETTRRMISDLSPPGLYDLGLVPALQWLTVYLRAQTGLQVQLDCDIREERVAIETRVLVFKLVGELLRNVEKHAGVLSAQVLVEEDGEFLRVVVNDQGRGFEWQLDMFGSRTSDFGLWSVADRLQEIGGSLSINRAEGRSPRFVMLIPRRPTGELMQRIA